jgi:hypothetical protein
VFNGSSGKKDFDPCPEGPQQLVCVDVVDLGILPTQYGDKPKVRVVFYTADIDPITQKPYRVSGQYTNSLHEKAGLRKTLESWWGRKLTPEEADGNVDPEALIGKNAFASIVHSSTLGKNGKPYANLGSIMPLPKGMPELKVPADFVRTKDKPAKSDDSVPF